MTPALLETLVCLAAKYGPDFVTNICALFKKEQITVAEVEQLFATVKPYEAYNINPPATPAA